MNLMKKLLCRFKDLDPKELNISTEEWQNLGPSIHFFSPDYMDKIDEFAKLPF